MFCVDSAHSTYENITRVLVIIFQRFCMPRVRGLIFVLLIHVRRNLLHNKLLLYINDINDDMSPLPGRIATKSLQMIGSTTISNFFFKTI